MAPVAIETQMETLKVENDTSYVPRGDVKAEMKFFQQPADGSQPFSYVEKQPEGQPQDNFANHPEAITIHDIRNSESDFNLDKDAFQAFLGVTSAMKWEDWGDDENIKHVYYPEVVKLILDSVPGSHKVTLFDHTVRGTGKRGPVPVVHVDQTIRSTEWRVRNHESPEEADALLKGRVRIINVWRPINGTVQRDPLTFASADTVDRKDLRPVEFRYPHRTAETAGVLYNPAQKFYYWSGMDNSETVFLKCFDTGEGIGLCTPHSSFKDHRTPEGAKVRASCEVRCIVYG